MKKNLSNTTARDARQLGNNLARFRKKLRLTQNEVAKLAGLLQKTVSTAEAGEEGTQIKTIFKIFAALNLELTIKTRGS